MVSTRAELFQFGKMGTIIIQMKIFEKLSSTITWKVDQMHMETTAQREKVKNN